MKVSELSKAEGISVLCMPNGEREIEGGYVGDLLSWVMGRATQNNVWVTIMSNMNIVAVAVLTGVSCIILAEGVTPDESTVQTAKEKGINILVSEKDTFTTVKMLSEYGI